jgi:hypothetical protein
MMAIPVPAAVKTADAPKTNPRTGLHFLSFSVNFAPAKRKP